MIEPTPPARIRYEQPAIVRREQVVGLLFTVKSDPKNDGQVNSDVNVKANICPVRW